jgi:electron transport complex protein RnfG
MLPKLRHFFRESWLLVASAFFCGLLLAATNAALSPRIELNKTMKLTNLARDLLPEAKTFVPLDEPLEITGLDGRTEPSVVYRAMAGDRLLGWVFRAAGSGFADKIELVVAVDPSFRKLAGFNVLASNETPGFGSQIKEPFFRNQFVNAPADRFTLVSRGDRATIDSTIVAISGATISSTGVVQAMNHYLPQIREQLLQKGLIGNGAKP